MAVDYQISTFGDYIAKVRSKNTALKYMDSAQHFLNYCDDRGLKLDSLPPNTMSEFVMWLTQRGLANSSIHVYTNGAKSYLRWCEQRGLSLPPLKTDLPKVPESVPNALRGPAIVAYLKEASQLHEPYRSALLLLPYTGLRSSELVSLRMSTDIRKIQFPVRGEPGQHREHLSFVVRGKGTVIRLVPLLMDGVGIFHSYLKNWRRHVHADSDWLFPGQGEDGHIATRSLRHFIQQIRSRVTNGRLTPHTLRDTYTTALWHSGVDIAVISKALGHKDMKTTFAHYLDIRSADVLGAVVQKDARLIMQSPDAMRTAGAVAHLDAQAKRHGYR